MNKWPIEVQREHVALLQFVWIELLPKAFGCFTLEDAWKTWAKFKENPKDPSLKHLKTAVNELWLLHIQAN
jgi:hypothetical protein